MSLSAARRGQLVLLITAVASGSAGYCLGRYRTDSQRKIAFGAGEGYDAETPSPPEESLSSRYARELYGRGLYREAFEEAKRVLLVNPSDAGAYAVAKLAGEKLAASSPPAAPMSGSEPGEENKRRAVKHWNAGIIFFQAGKYDKSRDEWLLCRQFDPGNSDCQTGLARLDSSYGGGK